MEARAHSPKFRRRLWFLLGGSGGHLEVSRGRTHDGIPGVSGLRFSTTDDGEEGGMKPGERRK